MHISATQFTTAFVSIGGFLFGYNLGLMSGALPAITKDLQLTEVEAELIVAGGKIGATIGIPVVSVVMSYFGRRPAAFFTGFVSSVAPVIAMLAEESSMLFVSRLVAGVGLGCATLLAPVYIAEIASPEKRGALIIVNEFMLAGGVLLSIIADWFLFPNWRLMNAVPLLPAATMLLSPWLLPESPLWLARQGRLKEAGEVLALLGLTDDDMNGVRSLSEDSFEETSDDEISLLAETKAGPAATVPELRFTKVSFAEETEIPESLMVVLKELMFGPSCKGFYIAMFIAIFAQAAGPDVIVNYAPSLLTQAGVESDEASIMLSILIAAMKIVGALIAMFRVDNSGRRPLFITGSLLMSVSMVAISAGTFFPASTATLITGISGAMFFTVAFSFSWAGLVGVIISEFFSMRMKPIATTIALTLLFACGALVEATYLTLLKEMGSGVYLLYGALAACGALFVFLFLPETKGKTLQEVQLMLKRK